MKSSQFVHHHHHHMQEDGPKLKADEGAGSSGKQTKILSSADYSPTTTTTHQASVMDLAKELVFGVLNERVRLNGNGSGGGAEAQAAGNEDKMWSAKAKASKFLEQSMGTEIHVLMGHEGCRKMPTIGGGERGGGWCPAVQKLEVWSFKILDEKPADVQFRPPMLPLFLNQALRSQLYFSPLRSWLSSVRPTTTNPTSNRAMHSQLFPIVQVLDGAQNTAKWPPPLSNQQHESHKFPPCAFQTPAGTQQWLVIEVYWLKREHFIDTAPTHCPFIELDDCHDEWVLPDGEQHHHHRKEYHHHPSMNSPSCSSDSETSANDSSMPNSPMERWKMADTTARSGGIGSTPTTHHQRQFARKSRKLAANNRNDSDEHESSHGLEEKDKLPPTAGSPAAHFRRRTFLKKAGKIGGGKTIIDWEDDYGEAGKTTKGGGIDSKAANAGNPVMNYGGKISGKEEEKEEEGKQKWPTATAKPLPLQTGNNNNIGTMGAATKFANPFRRSAPARRLICNFEESILNGRMMPTSTVNGYCLQLTVVPRCQPFGIQRFSIPVQTFFFNEMAENSDEISKTPAYLHLARCELDNDGIQVPRQCKLQAVLFNPQGSVVKIFMVEMDLLDMPPNSTTFIRQRTFSETGNNSDDVGNGKNTGAMGVGGGSTSPLKKGPPPRPTAVPQSAKVPSRLRFLIHLRLASNESGTIRLHTDIRMLFSNKSEDLDGLEIILGGGANGQHHQTPVKMRGGGGEMQSRTEMPQQPKYSPVK